MITGRMTPCLVLFETATEVDGQFGATKTWVEFSTAFVGLEPMRGAEKYSANELESIVTHTVRGGYYDLRDITPHMRMVYDPTETYGESPSVVPSTALVFNILAVMPAHNDKSDVVIKVEQEGRNYGEINS